MARFDECRHTQVVEARRERPFIEDLCGFDERFSIPLNSGVQLLLSMKSPSCRKKAIFEPSGDQVGPKPLDWPSC